MMTNHEGHIKLWNELARTGNRSKTKAFDTLFPELDKRIFDLQCFACVEDDQKYARGNPEEAACVYCPITDADGMTCCNGFFDEWRLAKTKKERKRLAAIIRDLPWKEKDHA